MLNMHTKVEGEYTVVRRKADGSEVERIGPFKNLITDSGLDSLGTRSGPGSAGIYSCMVGTSNSTPAFTDVTLGNRVATSPAPFISYNISRSPSYNININLTFRFGQGVAAGNLAEVGVGVASSEGRPGGAVSLLFSRALIVDGSGNPTTITVLSDEFLDVTYTLRFFIDTAPSAPYTIVDSETGITHTLVSRLCDDTTASVWYSGSLLPSATNAPFLPYTQNVSGVPITFSASPSSSFVGGTQGSSATDSVVTPYVPGSHTSEITGTLGLTLGNEGFGIGAIKSSRPAGNDSILSFTTGVTISPPIIKTASKTLKIGWKLSWSRV